MASCSPLECVLPDDLVDGMRLTRIAVIPRQLKQDDEYMGYDLPAGSTVVGNVWYATSAIGWYDT